MFAARLDEIDDQWQNLVDLSSLRKQRLNGAVDFYQFFADADDVDHWMVDTLRLVSSDDVGRDEASAQSLLKKHKVSRRATQRERSNRCSRLILHLSSFSSLHCEASLRC